MPITPLTTEATKMLLNNTGLLFLAIIFSILGFMYLLMEIYFRRRDRRRGIRNAQKTEDLYYADGYKRGLDHSDDWPIGCSSRAFGAGYVEGRLVRMNKQIRELQEKVE